ncbi:iron-sulfur cluster-binding protein like protein [Pleurocapsa sp. CCALA 161]|uniref:(2Fe-2S) ferredoxin domain-containing protein n=1 Tax=Pleurocapsa sp. CCALA 161 TaxID=2107688 RepID=UPI000D068EB5|nr:NAD(P)H-dependent oxidoreductase subunit E [Pleurocapsa sp. CCALA 161]PSB11530.1 iron-sulfur cluster-binding protein like protein [Pleurocapsa sp. CCALA 161]
MSASFNFNGKLSKIAYQKKRIKYLKLKTEQGKYWVKIPKQLSKQLAGLSPGCQLEVEGKVKQPPKTGKAQYKVKRLAVIASDKSATSPIKSKTVSLLPVFDSKIKSKAKVLICQKSNCWKKGGQQVCAEIESILSDRGLTKEIPIQKTGCLKQCKKAPALIMMPDKTCYNKVKPQQVAKMVEKHLITNQL